MLDRVALHQTRLRVPGVGLDSRGVALGARGLVLLPGIDRLVAFLAVYTQGHTLDALVSSLRIDVVRSKLKTREIAFAFDAGSSDRMDGIAEVARLTAGFTFTGTNRHFVQYRDASAPFGYDVRELGATNAELSLHHSTFSQAYDFERRIDLRELLLRLSPRRVGEVAAAAAAGAWVLAEPGLGPSLAAYFARSRVRSEVTTIEWPPDSMLHAAPITRWLFRLSEAPGRMHGLLSRTPGIAVFVPARAGVAVEQGHAHPVDLRACPVFDEHGLVLLRGGAVGPLVIERLPVLAPVESLQRSDVLGESVGLGAAGVASRQRADLSVALRLVPDAAALGRASASFIPSAELGLLRRLVYALGARAIAATRIAVIGDGAFLTTDHGVEALPLGVFYTSLHEAVYVPAGLRITPAVSPEAVFAALGAPADRLLFFKPEGGVAGILRNAFVPLERALIEPERWTAVDGLAFEELVAEELPEVRLEPLGFRALGDAER